MEYVTLHAHVHAPRFEFDFEMSNVHYARAQPGVTIIGGPTEGAKSKTSKTSRGYCQRFFAS